jgi:pyrroline-5-carboxylate reductase
MHATGLNRARIAFYGAGAMAEAIVRGLIEGGVASPGRITVMNRHNADRLEELRSRYGVAAAFDPAARESALSQADIIVLAMKPKDAAAALKALRPLLKDDQLIVSVIAGLSIATMQRLLGRPQPIARTMPNTSSTIGLGAAGISFSASVPPAGREQTLAIFGAIGLTAVVDESQLDAVTAVSGSGPAYLYYMMEAMIEAGVSLGLPPDIARELTVQTVRGAAEMVRRTGEDPAGLRRKVTSPNGTTQAALEVLERLRFREAVGSAMSRCAERSGELGRAIAEEAERQGGEERGGGLSE